MDVFRGYNRWSRSSLRYCYTLLGEVPKARYLFQLYPRYAASLISSFLVSLLSYLHLQQGRSTARPQPVRQITSTSHGPNRPRSYSSPTRRVQSRAARGGWALTLGVGAWCARQCGRGRGPAVGGGRRGGKVAGWDGGEERRRNYEYC